MKKNDLLQAVEKSLVNAEQLFDEAIILKNHHKIARAYTLFQFSIEEIGKAAMAFNFALHGDLENRKEVDGFLKNFRDHKIKTEKSQGLDFMLIMISEANEFTKKLLNDFLERDKQFSLNLTNDMKNFSLYTSLVNKKFSLPEELISKKDLEEIELSATLRLRIAKPFFNFGVKNFDTLDETKHLFDEEKALKEGAEKLKTILNL